MSTSGPHLAACLVVGLRHRLPQLVVGLELRLLPRLLSLFSLAVGFALATGGAAPRQARDGAPSRVRSTSDFTMPPGKKKG